MLDFCIDYFIFYKSDILPPDREAFMDITHPYRILREIVVDACDMKIHIAIGHVLHENLYKYIKDYSPSLIPH